MNEITYNMEVADLKAFRRHYRRTAPAMRRLYLFMLLMFAGFSLQSALNNESSAATRVAHFFVMLVVLLAFTAVMMTILGWITQFRAYRGAERHGMVGEHTITLMPDALHERTTVNDTKTLWRGVLRIDSTARHIFIFIQPNMAHVIPRRAFPNAADADEFLTTARVHFKAAQSDT